MRILSLLVSSLEQCTGICHMIGNVRTEQKPHGKRYSRGLCLYACNCHVVGQPVCPFHDSRWIRSIGFAVRKSLIKNRFVVVLIITTLTLLFGVLLSHKISKSSQRAYPHISLHYYPDYKIQYEYQAPFVSIYFCFGRWSLSTHTKIRVDKDDASVSRHVVPRLLSSGDCE